MQMYRIIAVQRWTLGSLAVIWLSLGGLALTEQLNIVPETGSYDEQALTLVQLAVKSETLDPSIGASLPDLHSLSIAIPLGTSIASVIANPITSFVDSAHARSLPRFTCCYRI